MDNKEKIYQTSAETHQYCEEWNKIAVDFRKRLKTLIIQIEEEYGEAKVIIPEGRPLFEMTLIINKRHGTK